MVAGDNDRQLVKGWGKSFSGDINGIHRAANPNLFCGNFAAVKGSCSVDLRGFPMEIVSNPSTRRNGEEMAHRLAERLGRCHQVVPVSQRQTISAPSERFPGWDQVKNGSSL